MTIEAFKRAIDLAGSQTKFAEATGMTQQLVSYYVKHSKPIPAEFVLAAEAAFGVSRHDLRPDIYPRQEEAA
jgi:DNA-binding transcriptional regulator YdaS (Cro superfamily)